jgi:membrane protein implicated in regulation of membrane protease activity
MINEIGAIGFIIIALILGILDIFIFNTFFIGFLSVMALIAAIVFLFTGNLFLSLLFSLIGGYIYYLYVYKRYKGDYTVRQYSEDKILNIKNTAVIKEIKDGKYIVEIDGELWAARSDENLNVGDKVEIQDKGAVLKVRKIK